METNELIKKGRIMLDKFKEHETVYAVDFFIDHGAELFDTLERYEKIIKEMFIAGNHVALVIDINGPAYWESYDKALEYYGAGDKYEVWCCWANIMKSRDSFEALNPEDTK